MRRAVKPYLALLEQGHPPLGGVVLAHAQRPLVVLARFDARLHRAEAEVLWVHLLPLLLPPAACRFAVAKVPASTGVLEFLNAVESLLDPAD